MFGGIGISSYTARNALWNGISNGQSLGQIAGGLLNEALGLDTFINKVNCFIIDQQTGIEMQLPVNPEKIKLRWGRKTETVNILNLGEVDFTTGDKLTEVSFESFFPAQYVPTYCVTAMPPSPDSANAVMNAWKSRFQEPVKNLKDPIQLIITGAQDINMLCLLSSYESDEHGGEPGDIYYTATFREWPTLVKMPATVAGIFGTQEGLWKLAKQHYGDGESWSRIAIKNATRGIGGGIRL